MSVTPITWLWAGFVAVMGVMMVLDLGIFNKKAHVMSVREAGVMVGIWWALAAAFALAVYFVYGHDKAFQFVSAYILEQSLSVDNLFVFILVFTFFGIGPEEQPRVLHWGILGAIAMRFIFIFAGLSLLEASHMMFYVFGAILVFTGAKMLFSGDEQMDPAKNPALKLLHKFLPVTQGLHGHKFFTRIDGVLHATPLFAALVVIEGTDLIFAVDSIPAALGVSSDLFVVYTSNIFAVMGLRSMYFLLAGSMSEFKYLKTGVSAVLVFVGVKMIAKDWYHVSTGHSLLVIGGVLVLSIVASIAARKKHA
ncbi:MAG: TerC family protein [Elusimicrobiota bacterium]|nr:MAG: TerC family protein [Elusimicrobiota bacterium]